MKKRIPYREIFGRKITFARKIIFAHKIIFALGTAIVIFLCSIPTFPSAANSGKTTQEQLDEALQEREDLQNSLEANEEELAGLKDNQNDLKKDLKSLNEQLTEVSENLEELERQIREKEAEIELTNQKLASARETEKWQYECMVKRIQYMYEVGQMDYLTMLFSVDSFGDMLNYANYMSAITEYDSNMLADYEATRQFIEEQEGRLQQELLELADLRQAAEEEKSRVAGLVGQTSNSIARYGDQIDAAEEEVRAKEAELKKMDEDIEALRKKIEAEKALSLAAANAAWRDISEVSFADGDRALLAAIIYCEAGGEPYEGKVAVGAVVINRVLSSKYPDTVVGVIYQKSQFSPVASGRLELVLSSGKATAACYQAADEAMSGVTNVGNCLYFRTPIEGLTGINIGGHVFY
ncbi:MAG: cell wall hydrolase [Lachnospiraceae bacterium]|nr:cell wall hydrolase [Lachnospiraceae bacterium]